MRMLPAVLLAAAFALPATARDGAAQTPVPKGTVEQVVVHGKALERNLPPSYQANRVRRYPVVYLLHGYGLTPVRWK